MGDEPKRRRGCLRKVLWSVGLAAVGFGIFVGIAFWFGNDTRSAQETCHHFVKDDLKAPGTARFETFNDAQVSSEGRVWTVEGFVDSENGFGALLRTHYRCEIRKDEDSYTLLDLEYDE